MLTLIISTSLLISHISSAPVATCSDQQNCLNAQSLFDVESDEIEICLSYDNTREECAKEDSISYACYNDVEEDKIEGFGGEEGVTQTMCIITDCKRDAAPEQRFVEFGLKDGRGCADSSSTTELNGFTSECRAADADTGDILCGGKQNQECIHKIFYECPTVTTKSPENTDGGGSGIPTCNLQQPCLAVDISYDDCTNIGDGVFEPPCDTVRVSVTYDDTNPECQKDPDPISHVCWSTEIIFDEASGTDGSGSELDIDGNKIEDFPAGGNIVLTGECNPTNNYIEIGFKDAQGCGSGGNGEGAIQITFDHDNDPATDDVECRWEPAADICNGGNADQCIYQIYYDSSQCPQVVEAHAILNEKKDSVNVFGMKNVSESTTISIWSMIIIGGFIVIFVAVVLGYWYCKSKGNGKYMEKEMTQIAAETPKSPETPQIDTNIGTIEIIENE
eukprot:7730_1